LSERIVILIDKTLNMKNMILSMAAMTENIELALNTPIMVRIMKVLLIVQVRKALAKQ
jgi:hypothetical protein